MIAHRPPRHVASTLRLALLASLSAASTYAQASGPGPLFPLARYDVDGTPLAIASADWNLDGHADLATANGPAGSFSFLAGRGDAVFHAAVSVAAGSDPEDIVAADWNGDGRPDLATAASNGAWVVLGLGPSGFAAAVPHAPGVRVRGLAADDFDGDGALDLVLTKPDANSVGTLLGVGDGAFLPALSSSAGPTPRTIAAGDFDGDGVPDALVANDPSSFFSFLRGRGNGTFHAPVLYGVAIYPYSVAAADLDLDGDLDALVGHYNGATDVAVGTGTGAFALPAPIAVVAGDCTGFVLADLDADGDPDVVLPGTNQGARVVENLSGLVFSTVAMLPIVGQDALAGDWNGDGSLDLALPGSGEVGVALGLDGLTYESLPHHPLPGGTWFSFAEVMDLTAADLDGDGWLDLAASRQSVDSATVYSNLGGGALAAPILIDMGADNGGIEAPDLDGDGRADLVVSDGQGAPAPGPSVSVRLGLGGGAFGPLVVHSASAGFVAGRIAIGDLDADGALDLVTTSGETGNLGVFQGGGDGSLALVQSFHVPHGVIESPHGRDLALADFDEDGAPDLTIGLPGDASLAIGNAIALCRGLGDGSFGPAQILACPGPSSTGASIEASDLDLDGHVDIAVAGYGGPPQVFAGTGTLSPSAPFAVGGTGAPGMAEIADVTGDGWPDLVAGGLRGVHPGLGGLAFAAPLLFTQPLKAGIQNIVVADLDGNGAPDVATGDVYVSLHRHDPPVVSSIDGLYAGTSGTVAIQGAWLGTGTSASIDGVAVPVLASSPTSLLVQVAAAAPGWQDLGVSNGFGSSTVPDGVERWPNLSAAAPSIGESLDVELDNGAPGIRVLGLSALQAPPIALPGIWHQLELGLPAVLVFGSFGAPSFTSSSSFAIPGDAGLIGATIHLQAWALQGDVAGVHTQSFTNHVRVDVLP